MPRISQLPPPAPLTGLELSPLLQGGGLDAGVGVPILAYGQAARGAVAALRVPMAPDYASTSQGNPPAGGIRWNNADPALATQLFISNTDAENESITTALANVVAGGFVYLQGAADEGDADSSARASLQKWQVSEVEAGAGFLAVIGAVVASGDPMTGLQHLELTIQAPAPSPGYDRAVVTVVESEAGLLQLDASLGDYFVTTLTENVELQVVNPPAAGTISLRVQQGAGGHSIALPSGFLTQAGGGVSLSAGAGARDRIIITSDDSFSTADVDIGKDYR